MKPELLAPAGSRDALTAAVQNGADAVYLGLRKYSARKAADNFTAEELSEVLSYSHIRGVRVYLTLNTLTGDEDFESAYRAGWNAFDQGVDGLIVQDLGLAKRLIDSGVTVHASTQLTVYNKEGARQVQKLGFTRCVLARELSLSEIASVTKTVPIETEVFCHGALCMSYSGQCLMSFCQGGRSGNKGDCAQPCRLAYRFEGGPKRCHLSPADLCTLPFLDKLIQTGTASLKIEGRLKSADYVAAVTGIYRKAIDRIAAGQNDFYTPDDIDALTLAFCRHHFTSGHMLGKMPSFDITLASSGRTGLLIGKTLSKPQIKKGPTPLFEIKAALDRSLQNGDGISFGRENGGVISGQRENLLTVAGKLPDVKIGTPVYQTYSKSLSKAWRESWALGKEYKKVGLQGQFIARKREPLLLLLRDGQHACETRLCPPESAVSRATSREDVIRALDTLGNTPYRFSSLAIEIDDGLFIPASHIKELKRLALDNLTKLRVKTDHQAVFLPFVRPDIGENPLKTPTKRACFFYRAEDFPRFSFESAPYRIYLPLNAFQNPDVITAIARVGAPVYAALPFITKEGLCAKDVQAALPFIQGFLVQNIGDAELLRQYAPDKKLAADLSMNLISTATAGALRAMGFTTAALSPETNPDFLPLYPEELEPEIIIEGRIPVMRSEHCLIATANGAPSARNCGVCRNHAQGSLALTDEKNGRYPILTDPAHCRTVLLSKESVDTIQKTLPVRARAFYGDRLIERINIWEV